MRLILYADLRLDALLSSALTKHGFRVQTVNTLEGIPNACERGVWPSLLLICLKPGDTDGLAFVESFRAGFGNASPPMVFIIARDSAALAQALQTAGVAEVFQGPVPLNQLIRRVKEVATGSLPPPVDPPRPLSVVRTNFATDSIPTSLNSSPEESHGFREEVTERETRLAWKSIPPPESVKPPEPPAASIADAPETAPTMAAEAEDSGFDVDFDDGDADAESPAPEATPADTRVRWPIDAASLDDCRAALILRAKAVPTTGGFDDALVSETWKALTLAEVQALKSVDSGQASPEAESLALFSAQRLRLRTIIATAEQLLAANTERTVDGARVVALQQELDRDLKERLDPVLQAAVTSADLQQMKDLRALREALLLRRSDLDRVAARLKGEAEAKRVTGLLDLEEPAPEPPPRSTRRLQARLLSITSVAAQQAVRHPLLSGGVVAVIAGIALFFHLVVFDSFRLSNGPDVVDQTSGINGVERIERFGNTARVVVSDSFDLAKGLPELATHIGGNATIIVENERGIQVANVMPGQTVESKLPPAPPKDSEPTAATPPG